MKRFFKNNKYLFFIFITTFGCFLMQELIFRFLAFENIWGIEVIRIGLFVAVTSLILTFLFSLFHEVITKILICLFIFLSGSYSLIQLTFKNLIGNFMSVNAAGDGLGRVTSLVGSFVKSIKWEYLYIYIPLVLVIAFLFFTKKLFIKQSIKWYKLLIILILILGFNYVAILTLKAKTFQTSNVDQNYDELYRNPKFSEIALKQFGTTRFLYRDYVTLLFPPKDSTVNVDVPNRNTHNDSDDKIDYTRVIDDTEWKNLIANEKNTSILNIDNYFINQNITSKNEMTGFFKNKNLILVMVEAFDMMAIDQNLAPTLYKMTNEGWYFEKHYVPMYSCATGESEFIGLTSMVPNPTTCVPNTYRRNDFNNSIFTLFNRSNYYTTSYHNYIDRFYDRSVLHISMGSKQYYDRNAMGIKPISGWPSDEILFQKALPFFINQDQFFSFITTCSMHFPYDINTTITNKYWSQVKDLSYDSRIKRYMAKVIDLDKGLAYMLSELQRTGKLDDTIIILFGDHRPFNIPYSVINTKSSIDRLKDFNIDITPFIIYNPTMEPKKIETINSTFDILPTIANLFDLKYDPRYYAGTDIFSSDQHTAIWPNGSWVSDKGMYKASKGQFIKTIDTDIDPNYASITNTIVRNKFTIYDEVLKKNYFKYRNINK